MRAALCPVFCSTPTFLGVWFVPRQGDGLKGACFPFNDDLSAGDVLVVKRGVEPSLCGCGVPRPCLLLSGLRFYLARYIFL